MTIIGRRNRSVSSSPAQDLSAEPLRGESPSAKRSAAKNKVRRQSVQRRALWAEPLEPRALLDGGMANVLVRYPFWNIAQAADVNADGVVTAFDALRIVNELNLHGARSLDTSGASASEGPGQDNFIDVNNDNHVTAFDALLVINKLNSGGEGNPLVKFMVDIVASGTNDPITTINKGGFYEMRVLIQDLGELSYMGQSRPANGSLGAFTSFFDVQYNTSQTDVQTNESQIIFIGGTPTTSPTGTFTLTVNDGGTLKTTAPITFASSRVATAKNIQLALNAAGVLGADTVEVSHEPSGGNNRWRVRFINRLGNQNIPEMTGNIASLPGTGVTLSITQDFDGLPTTTAAYNDALFLKVRNDADYNPINTPIFYVGQRAGTRLDEFVDTNNDTIPDTRFTGINDVGGTGPAAAPFPGLDPTEILRVRMNATDAGVVNFNVNLDRVNVNLGTGLYGFTNPVTKDLMTIVNDSLTITEPLSAGNDPVNTTEGSVTPINIAVTANDVNNAPTPNTAKTVQSLNMAGAVGSAVILPDNVTVRYTPPGGDFSGVDTFTYVVRDQNGNTDIGTVTVNIAPVNDAPVVNGPNSQTFNEDTSRTFSTLNGNVISITDVDAGTTLPLLTLNLSVPSGSLQLGGTTGLSGVSGNPSSTITAMGTLSDINNALLGLTYTPVANANGTVNLTVSVNDNSAVAPINQVGSKIIPLNINAVNDPPTQTVPPGPFETNDEDPLPIPGITVNDIDAASGTLTVSVTTRAGSFGTYTVGNAAGAVVNGSGTSALTITGTLAQLAIALPTLSYNPVVNQIGVMTVDVQTNDNGNTGFGTGMSPLQSINITVIPKARPRAVDDTPANGVNYVFAEESLGGNLGPNVLANDQIHAGSTAHLLPGSVSNVMLNFAPAIGGASQAAPAGLIVQAGDVLSVDGALLPANFFGTITFNYVMEDTFVGGPDPGADTTGSVTVTITDVNDAPVAVADPLVTVAEDQQIAINVTSNDTDADGNPLTATIVMGPTNGTILSNVNGVVTYRPNADYFGPDSFSYQANDGTVNSANTITVNIDVLPVNDFPNADNVIRSSVPEDTAAVTIPIADLIAASSPGPANESGQTLTLQSVFGSFGGTVMISGSDVIFTPQANFNGNASFSFIVIDNGTPPLFSIPGIVSFSITPVNDAPVAVNDTPPDTGEEQTLVISVLANDSDVDVPPGFVAIPGQVSPGTTVNITSPPAVVQGTATVLANNTISFTPAAGFFGPVTIQYQLNDGSGGGTALSNIATVSITVLERNDPPVANNDPGVIAVEDITLSIDVFANDTDPDTSNTLWSFILVTPPTNGTALFNAGTRRVDYTPNANYNGPDSFVYRLNDQSPIAPVNLNSLGTALVSITVQEVNDAPVGGTDPATGEFTVIKDRDRTFTAASLLANDSPGLPANESGQSISITGVSPTSALGGSVTLVGGVITYTAPTVAAFPALDSFTYTLTDNGTTAGASSPQSVPVTVNIIIKDFVPTDVVGYVYNDADNDGVFDPNEIPLAGVSVTLAGTSDITGPITPITVQTQMDGFYEFLGIEPGNYTLTESSPFALGDGLETPGEAASLSAQNDVINLTLPLLGLASGQSVNLFGNQGVDTAQLTNSTGWINELLSSSSNNGFYLGTNMTGAKHWSWSLDGWDGADSFKITLDPSLAWATLEVTRGLTTYTKQIFQNPYDARNPNRPTTSPAPVANLARFRLLGNDANGNYIIRLDGTAEHFFGVGTPLAAAPAPQSGGEYVEGVDAAMAEESWA